MVLTNDDVVTLTLPDIDSEDYTPLAELRFSGPLRGINTDVLQMLAMAVLHSKLRVK